MKTKTLLLTKMQEKPEFDILGKKNLKKPTKSENWEFLKKNYEFWSKITKKPWEIWSFLEFYI